MTTALATAAHVLGTAPDGWQLVPTPSLQVLQDAVTRAIANNGIVAAQGPSGSGKSTALRHIASGLEVAVLQINATNAKTTNGMMSALLDQTGQPLAFRPRNSQAWAAALAERLRQHPHLVIVDEAQDLRTEAVSALLMLHEDGLARFSICLAGTGIEERMHRHPRLHNRVEVWVPFSYPQTLTDQLNLIRSAHPLLGNTDDVLLTRVQAAMRPANLRAWMHLTRAVLDRHPQASALTEDLARFALARKQWKLR